MQDSLHAEEFALFQDARLSLLDFNALPDYLNNIKSLKNASILNM
jgi:hypothetical protein